MCVPRAALPGYRSPSNRSVVAEHEVRPAFNSFESCVSPYTTDSLHLAWRITLPVLLILPRRHILDTVDRRLPSPAQRPLKTGRKPSSTRFASSMEVARSQGAAERCPGTSSGAFQRGLTKANITPQLVSRDYWVGVAASDVSDLKTAGRLNLDQDAATRISIEERKAWCSVRHLA